MGEFVGVTVEGGRQLRRALDGLGVDLGDLRDAHLRIAGIVADAARPATPRRTGDLERSVRPGGGKTLAVVRAGTKRVPYAPPIHWGWARRGITAQPWLVDAAHTTEPRWTAVLEDTIARLVDQAGRRG